MAMSDLLTLISIVGVVLAICVSIGTLIGNAVNYGKTIQNIETMKGNIEVLFKYNREKEEEGTAQMKILTEIQTDMKWLKQSVQKLEANFTEHTKG